MKKLNLFAVLALLGCLWSLGACVRPAAVRMMPGEPGQVLQSRLDGPRWANPADPSKPGWAGAVSPGAPRIKTLFTVVAVSTSDGKIWRWEPHDGVWKWSGSNPPSRFILIRRAMPEHVLYAIDKQGRHWTFKNGRWAR